MTHVDTSFIIDLAREQAKGVAGGATKLLHTLEHEEIGQSVFVACELEVGALGSVNSARERERVRRICGSMALIFPDDRFVAAYGALFQALAAGVTIPTMDLLIATIAVVEGAPLVTSNRKHFEPIRGLEILGY